MRFTSKLIKIANLLTITLIHFLVFIIPLFFALFLKTNNVFELNKLVLFKIFVWLLLLLLVLRIFFGERKLIASRQIWRENRNIIFVFLLLAISFAISTVFSVNPAQSIAGAYDHFMGLETVVILLLFGLVLYINIYVFGLIRIRTFLWIIAASSFFVSLYAIIQHFGFDPLDWAESSRIRAFSTLGQPNHLGSFLVMVIPIVAFLAYSAKCKIVKVGFVIIMLSNLMAMYYTLSMSSWIGLGAAAGFFVFYQVLAWVRAALAARKKGTREAEALKLGLKPGRIFLAAFIFLFIFFILIFNQSTTQTKIKNLFNPEIGSTSARLDFWQASLKTIKERPWIGHGPDTQAETVIKYYQPRWAIHSNINVTVNQAHNIFLDILLTRGIFGLAATAVFWFFIAWTILQNYKSGENRPLNLALAASLLAYFIYLQFNYTHITNQILFVSFLAILLPQFPLRPRPSEIFSEGGGESERGPAPRERSSFSGVASLLLKLLILITLTALAHNQITRQIKILQADSYFMEIRRAEIYNQFVLAFDLYDFLKSDSPGYDYYDRNFVSIMDNWSKRYDNDLFYEFVNERFEKTLPLIKSESFSDRLTRAKIYSSLGKKDSQYYPLAEADFTNLSEQIPELPMLWRELGEHYQRAGEYEKAIASFEKGLQTIPPLDSPGLNLEHRYAIIREMVSNYNGLMKAYEGMGETGKVEEYKREIEKLENGN